MTDTKKKKKHNKTKPILFSSASKLKKNRSAEHFDKNIFIEIKYLLNFYANISVENNNN